MMMREIEIKFCVRDLRRIRAQLSSLKAKLIQRRRHEANLRFDDGAGSLRKQGKALRLRLDDRARLTFKGPGDTKTGITSRREIEFVVEDFDLARNFLEALGYRKTVYYEKYRTIYKLGRNHIMLDELPYGLFVEIEGPTRRSIHAAADRLQLNPQVAVQASYLALFERLKGNLRLKLRDLTFDAFRGIRVRPADLQVTPAD